MKPLLLSLYVFCFLLPAGVKACISHGPQNQLLNLTIRSIIPDDLGKKSVGEIIALREGTLSELAENAGESECIDKDTQLIISGRLGGAELGRKIWSTSVPGVGIRVSYLDRTDKSHRFFAFAPFMHQRSVNKGETLSASDIRLRIELVKTGDIHASGVHLFSQPAVLTFGTSEQHLLVNLHQWMTFPTPVCNFDSPQVMTALPVSVFDRLQDSAGKHRVDIPVHITCSQPGGLLVLSVEGTSVVGHDDVLDILHSMGSAEGVGIRFWYHRQAVKLNTSFMVGIPQEWNGAKLTVPLSVGYETTGAGIRPGIVNAVAALHIDYL